MVSRQLNNINRVESHPAPVYITGAYFIGKEKKMEKEKKTKKNKRAEALEHVERIRVFGPAYYRKRDVVRILNSFIDLYIGRR